jgi:hypothetical protein
MDSYIDNGYIYILTHKSYNGCIKISRTNNLNRRLSNHSCACILGTEDAGAHIESPKMIYTKECLNYKIAELLIHQRLRKQKVNCGSSREFFNINLDHAIDTIKEIIEMVNNPIVINTDE